MESTTARMYREWNHLISGEAFIGLCSFEVQDVLDGIRRTEGGQARSTGDQFVVLVDLLAKIQARMRYNLAVLAMYRGMGFSDESMERFPRRDLRDLSMQAKAVRSRISDTRKAAQAEARDLESRAKRIRRALRSVA